MRNIKKVEAVELKEVIQQQLFLLQKQTLFMMPRPIQREILNSITLVILARKIGMSTGNMIQFQAMYIMFQQPEIQ